MLFFYMLCIKISWLLCSKNLFQSTHCDVFHAMSFHQVDLKYKCLSCESPMQGDHCHITSCSPQLLKGLKASVIFGTFTSEEPCDNKVYPFPFCGCLVQEDVNRTILTPWVGIFIGCLNNDTLSWI